MEFFLQMALRKNKTFSTGIAEINEWYISFDGAASKPPLDTSVGHSMRALMNEEDIAMAEKILGRPWKNSKMPRELRLDELSSWIDPLEEQSAYLNSQWIASMSELEERELRMVARV